MGDPNGPPLDARRLLETLDRHGAAVVIVGGFAATLYGANRPTFDVDIVPEWSDDNLGRLCAALRELDAKLRVPDAVEPVAFPIDPSGLRRFEISTWRTIAGDIDIIVGIPSAQRHQLRAFEDLRSRASKTSVFEITVLVASLDDVIESKEALARTPDLVALTELYALRRTKQSRFDTDRE